MLCKKFVKFEVIFEDYNEINTKESIVIMRNLLYCFSEIHVYSLLESMSNQMREKCILALGENDYCDKLKKLIKSFGFECSNVWGVYYKP